MSKPAKSLGLCFGCHNDFYNGKNDLGVKQCWSYPSAEVVRRIRVGIMERPPYSAKRAAWTFSCHKPDGAVQVNPDNLDSKGFWKR